MNIPPGAVDARTEVPGRTIPRPRLAQRVGDALDAGSVILTAGAGSGKTTVLEQAIHGRAPVAWIGCSDADRDPGTLLSRIVSAITEAAPGSSDVLAELLATGIEPVDPLAATRELVAELSRLLVEPLVLVIDDAEHIDGASDSLALLSELVRAADGVHIVIASRRPLELRVAKPRTAGRLSEFGVADLVFSAEECEELLRVRAGTGPSSGEVDAVMEATEGWPLGIALAAGMAAQQRAKGGLLESLGGLGSAPDLRAYLSEELLESLEPGLADAAVESSIVRAVTPRVAEALGLPDEFSSRLERAGMLVRRVEPEGAFAFHPLLRDFLLERLRDRSEDELRSLHAKVAAAVAADGDAIGATEHWLAAQRWDEAAAAIEREGIGLGRTSPELIRRWLEQLPATMRALPALRTLEGRIEWGAGRNAEAIEALRDAVMGFRERPNAPVDWLARSILIDALFATGEIDEIEATVEGWDGEGAKGAGGLAPAAAMYAAICLAGYGRFTESDELAAAASEHPESALATPLDALRIAFRDAPRGRLDEVRAGLKRATAELERSDPLGRRPHVIGGLAAITGDCGMREEALALWLQIREENLGGGLPVLFDATYAWCALLHARAGRLAEAEAELAQHKGEETGYRAFIAELAPAAVAALRGDAAEAVAAAERALAFTAGGPVMMRFWTAADLVPALVSVDRIELAERALGEMLEEVDRTLPGHDGRQLRARLLALRAWIRQVEGDLEGADRELQGGCKEAGEGRRHLLRREWERLEPLVWGALERGALESEESIAAVADAFAGGSELVPFLDHPSAAVRRAALPGAVASGDPRALGRLELLAQDRDRELAGAASRAIEKVGSSLPPLRFQMLGRFGVRRGDWRLEEADWRRPIDARLVRFLLVHLDEPVAEDVIFEALWPGRPATSARRSLQVAVSGARRVLDPPGAETSVIQAADRTYRLTLGDRDLVDAEEFRLAGDAGLWERGPERLARLERARSLWRGEPLPEERYSDWATAYRERLIDHHIAVLSALIELNEVAGANAEAADAARDLVELDGLNEEGHRALMRAYARSGRRGHALRQYLECRRALVDGLGVEPGAVTSQLQARILAGEPV